MTTKHYDTGREVMSMGLAELPWRRGLAGVLLLAVMLAAGGLVAGQVVAGLLSWLAGLHPASLIFASWFAFLAGKVLFTILNPLRGT